MNKLQALNTWMTPKMPLLILGALALGLLSFLQLDEFNLHICKVFVKAD